MVKKRKNDPTNISAICRERGVDQKLVEQRMRTKGMTLEESISRPVRGRIVRDWLIFRRAKKHRQFNCSVCGTDWMTLIPDVDTCQMCYHMEQADIEDWIKDGEAVR